MQYVCVDPKTLSISVRTRPGAKLRTVSCEPRAADVIDHPISHAILFGVRYPATARKDRREGRTGIKRSLRPPDPWLVSLGLVMWDGIVQGFTWDVIKLSVKAALKRLQHERIAPIDADIVDKRASSTEFGLSWSEYTKEGKQREMFFGLRRFHRREVTRKTSPFQPLLDPPKKKRSRSGGATRR
jgi:hypothetical protein